MKRMKRGNVSHSTDSKKDRLVRQVESEVVVRWIVEVGVEREGKGTAAEAGICRLLGEVWGVHCLD